MYNAKNIKQHDLNWTFENNIFSITYTHSKNNILEYKFIKFLKITFFLEIIMCII